MERKLTAILSADVKGYSRLVADDDEDTVTTITQYRDTMATTIAEHRGRIVDSPGDNVLAEFASVIDSVNCAVEIQAQIAELNEEKEPHRKMEFRMGVNLGDVIVDGDRIYGDGVNIAARLESLALPGGICISENVHEEIANRIDFTLEDLGKQSVKNIDRPIHVWRILTADQAESAQIKKGITKKVVATIGILAVVAAGIWFYTARNSIELTPPPALSQSQSADSKPSIIVLPFINRSDDPEQEYFSDGITEDLTTDLTKLSELIVISRNTAFSYKNKPLKLSEIHTQLGVGYAVEGSVRKFGGNVRITAQLVDARTNQQLWSERYDRPLEEIFELQDQIRRKIVTALRVKLSPEEQERFERAPTNNLEAYDFYLQAQERNHRARRELNPSLFAEAKVLYEKALDLDPNYAAAYMALGLTHQLEWWYGWSDTEIDLEKYFVYYRRAEQIDDSYPSLHAYIANWLVLMGDFDAALKQVDEALQRWPENTELLRAGGSAILFSGDVKGSLAYLEKAFSLTLDYQRPYATW